MCLLVYVHTAVDPEQKSQFMIAPAWKTSHFAFFYCQSETKHIWIKKEPAADFYYLSLLVDFCLHANLYYSEVGVGPIIRLYQWNQAKLINSKAQE